MNFLDQGLQITFFWCFLDAQSVFTGACLNVNVQVARVGPGQLVPPQTQVEALPTSPSLARKPAVMRLLW